MKYLLSFFLFAPLLIQAQTTETWNNFSEDNYAITYPSSWALDTSGQMGTVLILFAPSESDSDLFKENINLIIQDIATYKLDLDAYAKLSTEQIKTMITNSKILENKKIKQGNNEYQKVTYTGDLQSYHLTFEQYYWVTEGKAYVLTFTSEQSKFKQYKETGEKILNSFALASQTPAKK